HPGAPAANRREGEDCDTVLQSTSLRKTRRTAMTRGLLSWVGFAVDVVLGPVAETLSRVGAALGTVEESLCWVDVTFIVLVGKGVEVLTWIEVVLGVVVRVKFRDSRLHRAPLQQ
ncbi:hypothetical protein chiPu_0026169, partial [Chiloscyllium punctatum]|nr:hypothetical protein [Chiloscyllium punctatum]